MNRIVCGAALAALVCGAAACSSKEEIPPTTTPPPTSGAAGDHIVEREVKGGRLHATALPAFARAADLSAAALLGAARPELEPRLGALDTDSFRIVGRHDSATLSGARLAHVTMRQVVHGVPIEGSYLRLTARAATAGDAGQLVASGFRVFPAPRVNTVAAVTGDDALSAARVRLRAPRGAATARHELVIRDLEGRLQLVWDVAFRGSYLRASVIANGPGRGRVLVEDGRIYESAGAVTAVHVTGGAPGGAGEPTTAGLAGLRVTAADLEAFTDGAGAFSIDAPDGSTIEARLAGRASTVVDHAGADLIASTLAAPEVALALNDGSGGETELSQVTAYAFADATRTYLERNGVSSDALGAPLTTNVNLDDICNAFYDPFARTINFFRAGGGCNNSAIDSVVVHEYGHFADDVAGGITEGGLSEGWGDLLACYVLGNPAIGNDLFPGEEAFRSCLNDYVYPPDGLDEIHNLGQAWAGFAWRVREGLIAELGEAEGDALARALILPNLVTNATDIPTAVRETFLRDDDDGDLSNETPHWAVLSAAAEHHGLMFALEADVTPPGAIEDLAVTGVAATSVTLQWTATGDDGGEGTAATYELRFSTEPITADNFAAASPAPAPAPTEAGTVQSASVAVPPGTTLYFAIVARDEQLNAGGLSNVVEAATPEGVVVYEEGAEGGLGDWEATGLWHVTDRRASEGLQSFWYGQEETGNYDTGAANSGVLTSPVIELADAIAPALVFDELVDVEEGDVFDLLTVTITDADDPTVSVVAPKQTGNTGGAFRARVISLAELEGRRVRIALSFDTVDSFANELEGWFVDHVRVLSAEPGDSCAHELCAEGEPLDPSCSPCAQTVCDVDAFCCEVGWDGVCVQEAQELCGLTCSTCGDGVCDPGEGCETCPSDCGTCTPACEHGLCTPGAALEPTCDPCAAAVCDADAFCCDTFWDRVCVQEAEAICGLTCSGCSHDLCDVGEPLDATCDPCVETVCATDDYCCNNAWDARCVSEAAQMCGLECEQCGHDLCQPGGALVASCDPCAAAVCEADAFCCSSAWDSRCVEQAGEICGLSCTSVR